MLWPMSPLAFRTIGAAFLAGVLIAGPAAFFAGMRIQRNADIADQAEQRENESELLRLKNRKSLAAGIRTQKAQAKTEAFFQELRADYENDKKNNPDAGCVLDADSLRRWNAANTGPDGDAAGEPDAGVQPLAEPEGG